MMKWRLPTITTLAVLLMMFWLSMPESVDGRPSWANPTLQFVKRFEHGNSQCDVDSDMQELCQRCAKATKSNFAYPMCCSNVENAVGWCKDYLYFGIQ